MHYQGPVSTLADRASAQAVVSKVRHWHHKFEVFPGVVTPGSYDPQFLLEKLQLPADMTGMRVLDIGCAYRKPRPGRDSLRMAESCHDPAACRVWLHWCLVGCRRC